MLIWSQIKEILSETVTPTRLKCVQENVYTCNSSHWMAGCKGTGTERVIILWTYFLKNILLKELGISFIPPKLHLTY